jgi:hypothetical protein
MQDRTDNEPDPSELELELAVLLGEDATEQEASELELELAKPLEGIKEKQNLDNQILSNEGCC